jgi:hypothetical protein
MDEIVIALISAGSSICVGLLTLVGVLITNSKAKQQYEKKTEVSQAVVCEKVDELTREVREHNHFAQRMPVVEEQIKVINHRLNDLEEYHKGA